MKFKKYLNEEKFNFAGKNPVEIKAHYLEKTKGDVVHAYNLLDGAIKAVYREPEVKQSMYNALRSLYNDYEAQKDKEKPKNKWEQFEHDLKHHDWYHEKSEDPRISKKGREKHIELQNMYRELAKEDKEKANNLVQKHVPREALKKKVNEDINF